MSFCSFLRTEGFSLFLAPFILWGLHMRQPLRQSQSLRQVFLTEREPGGDRVRDHQGASYVSLRRAACNAGWLGAAVGGVADMNNVLEEPLNAA